MTLLLILGLLTASAFIYCSYYIIIFKKNYFFLEFSKPTELTEYVNSLDLTDIWNLSELEKKRESLKFVKIALKAFKIQHFIKPVLYVTSVTLLVLFHMFLTEAQFIEMKGANNQLLLTFMNILTIIRIFVLKKCIKNNNEIRFIELEKVYTVFYIFTILIIIFNIT